ncbi:hypothetical protein K474DRAFT_1660335 [Panus rudis PR-1116 ss-1]|nr:hypothetical protein K474DRAFT_1660335 [Panus rudis PR-1116 ss-1]
MLKRITGNEHQLSLLAPRDRAKIAAKLFDIGKSLLRTVQNDKDALGLQSGKAQEAIPWLQIAFSMLERTDDAMGIDNLKRAVLRTLSRAYFLSSSENPDNLARAETSLSTLLGLVDDSFDRRSPEYQQLRWMRIALLRKRKCPVALLSEGFHAIIDHMKFTEHEVEELLREIRTLENYELVTELHHHTIEAALLAETESGATSINAVLLSLVFHCARNQNHEGAMTGIQTAFDRLVNADYNLPKVESMACLTLLWQFGDRHYTARRWSKAADWFLAATHRVFEAVTRISQAKSCRKAALCYVQQKDYARASAIIQRCPQDEAATHYVSLLTSVRQGLEDEAIQAAQAMAASTDLDRNMLLLTTQLAHESGMKNLLLLALEELLEKICVHDQGEFQQEALLLTRCILRLLLKLVDQPGNVRMSLVKSIIHRFQTAIKLVGSLQATTVAKDISWLWRTAYNTAVHGCSTWQDAETQIAELFEEAQKLLEIYVEAMLTDVSADAFVYLVNATFATAAGKMFAFRKSLTSSDRPDAQMCEDVAKILKTSRDRIKQVRDSGKLTDVADCSRAQMCIQVLTIFEAEIICCERDWQSLLVILELDDLEADTFETIADLMWVEKDCPIEVLCLALQRILRACLDLASLSVKKFSRWLRAICTILLSRNMSADRAKALTYIEQAVVVMEEHPDPDEDGYPQDERQWLLGTAYNTGLECLHASLADEAKQWFEISTIVCRFVPEGQERAAKISETYSHLLTHYTPRTS